MARIAGIQKSLLEARNSSLIKLGARLRQDLDEILKQEEVLWYQKARVEWINDGDRNTSYFHMSTVLRRWRNKIVSLKNENGDWFYDESRVKSMVQEYFTLLYQDETIEEAKVQPEIPYGISTEFSSDDWQMLTRRYTRSKIDEVIKSMGSLKAPGPDGFQAIFYQKQWELIKPNVYDMVLDVLEGKGLPATVNETFLVLIPKIDRHENPAHFRPISLCNVAYKIITKAIVNRIKPILPLITSVSQASFIPGRQITDNIVIVQEIIHTL